MPADNTLNFTTNVDLTGMNTGLDAAQGKVEEFSAATQASVLAVDAVWDVFVEKNAAGLTAFDEILEHHITRTAEYEAAMEAQIATAEAAAEATANQGIAQTILSELTAKRTQQEINTNNAMRGAYAAAAERTAFAISSNADYAASVQAITAAYSELIATQATVPAGVAAGAAGAVAVEDVAATGGAAAAQAAIAENDRFFACILIAIRNSCRVFLCENGCQNGALRCWQAVSCAYSRE